MADWHGRRRALMTRRGGGIGRIGEPCAVGPRKAGTPRDVAVISGIGLTGRLSQGPCVLMDLPIRFACDPRFHRLSGALRCVAEEQGQGEADLRQSAGKMFRLRVPVIATLIGEEGSRRPRASVSRPPGLCLAQVLHVAVRKPVHRFCGEMPPKRGAGAAVEITPPDCVQSGSSIGAWLKTLGEPLRPVKAATPPA